MKNNSNVKLELSDKERKAFRANKITKATVLEYSPDELEERLGLSKERAKEIYALADFQQIPSLGLKFAKDLLFLGYYRVNELVGKDGAKLTDEYEKKKGYTIDPCVEDQFRLVVHFSKNQDFSKKWWDFTEERKEYRMENGYPDDRPSKKWTEAYGIN